MKININENAAKAVTQCQQILAYLQTGQPLTQMQALQYFGCFRLASRISDLRSAGYTILCERVKTSTDKYVGQYKMKIQDND